MPGRPWLVLDKINNSMKCKWCDQNWNTAKLETLKTHEISKSHIKHRDAVAGRLKVASGEETEAMKCVESLNKAVIDKLVILFRNAHALSLAGRPFSDYVWMASLDKMKGLDIGNTYLNQKGQKNLLFSLPKCK